MSKFTFFWTIVLTLAFSAKGQSLKQSIDGELNSYVSELNRKEVKTFLILEKAESKYDTSGISKLISQKQQFYIFSKFNNKTTLQKLEKGKEYTAKELSDFKGFELIKEREKYFKAKNNFINQKKFSRKIYFLPPVPLRKNVYLTAYFPDSELDFLVIDEKFDPTGPSISNEDWFKPLKEITDYLQTFITE